MLAALLSSIWIALAQNVLVSASNPNMTDINAEATNLRRSLLRLSTTPGELRPSQVSYGFPTEGVHFQGIQQYGGRFLLSHSNTNEGGGILANLVPNGALTGLVLTPGFGHLGGIQVLGDVLVGAVAKAVAPRDPHVWFWDVKTPGSPSRLVSSDLQNVCGQPGTTCSDAPAVGAVRVGNRVALAILTTPNSDVVRFFSRGIGESSWTWHGAVSFVENVDTWCPFPQNINLFHEAGAPLDRLSMLTLCAPTPEGESRYDTSSDYVTLYTVNAAFTAPTVSYVSERKVSRGSAGGMRDAGGASINADGTLQVVSMGGHSDSPVNVYEEKLLTRGSAVETGLEPDLAAGFGRFVRVTQGDASDPRALRYSVGELDSSRWTVSWRPPVSYTMGAAPSIAMTNGGLVLEAHQSSLNTIPIALWYRVGTLSSAGTITWHTSATLNDDTGANVDVALSDLGAVVEAHNGSAASLAGNLYMRPGRLGADRTVVWGQVVNLGPGLDPSVAMAANGAFVVVYRSTTTNGLMMRTGKVDLAGPTFTWSAPTQYDTGANPSVGLSAQGGLFEVHTGSVQETSGNLYYRTAAFNSSTRAVTWRQSGGQFWDTGREPSVTIDAAENVVESHNGRASPEQIYYSVGTAR